MFGEALAEHRVAHTNKALPDLRASRSFLFTSSCHHLKKFALISRFILPFYFIHLLPEEKVATYMYSCGKDRITVFS